MPRAAPPTCTTHTYRTVYYHQASSIAAPRAAAAAAAATAAAAAAAAAAERLSEETECVICFAAARDCVLVPCGHAYTCMQCGGALASCPMCRAAVERAIRLYANGAPSPSYS